MNMGMHWFWLCKTSKFKVIAFNASLIQKIGNVEILAQKWDEWVTGMTILKVLKLGNE